MDVVLVWKSKGEVAIELCKVKSAFPAKWAPTLVRASTANPTRLRILLPTPATTCIS